MAHKHWVKRSVTHPWNGCTTPDDCSRRPDRMIAHGNITLVDTCSCGSTRESELNRGYINYGVWKAEK